MRVRLPPPALVAPPDYSQSNGCSDCEEYLGRWWEPQFVFLLAIIAYVVYLVGVGPGALVGFLVRAGRRTRPAT